MSAYSTLTVSRKSAISTILSKNMEKLEREEKFKLEQLTNQELENILEERETDLFNYIVTDRGNET